MKNFEISSVAEFHEMVSNQKIAPIYRGEEKSTYSLLPKIGRCYNYHSTVLADVSARKFSLVDEITSFQDFKIRAYPYLKHIPQNIWEWLTLAQHHGLATRLLDWTENPLVAGFFACYEQYSGDSVIYVLDRRQFDVPKRDESPFKISKTLILQSSHNTLRVNAQSGLFTVHPNPTEAFSSIHLQRWILKQSCLTSMASMIEKYGIHHASLFPGLDGVAEYMKHRWLLYWK